MVSAEKTSSLQQVAPDIWCMKDKIVNLFFVGNQSTWVLIDTGLYGSASRIKSAAEEQFGRNAKPAAIILTHGHFDHVGAVKELADEWSASVYAHRLELPFVTGRAAYPPPDPTVGGGLMARLSFMYPCRPIDLGERVKPLPDDNSVPSLDGWRWIHTPGHTFGHVSLFRESDRALIAGDAFVTTKQESLIAVLTQRVEMNGPPAYFTPDWEAARRSVAQLAALNPEIVATGHGQAMRGEKMKTQLNALARNFDALAVPAHGRYVDQPVTSDAQGNYTLPPAPSHTAVKVLAGIGIAAAAMLFMRHQNRRRLNPQIKRRRFRTELNRKLHE